MGQNQGRGPAPPDELRYHPAPGRRAKSPGLHRAHKSPAAQRRSQHGQQRPDLVAGHLPNSHRRLGYAAIPGPDRQRRKGAPRPQAHRNQRPPQPAPHQRGTGNPTQPLRQRRRPPADTNDRYYIVPGIQCPADRRDLPPHLGGLPPRAARANRPQHERPQEEKRQRRRDRAHRPGPRHHRAPGSPGRADISLQQQEHRQRLSAGLPANRYNRPTHPRPAA